MSAEFPPCGTRTRSRHCTASPTAPPIDAPFKRAPFISYYKDNISPNQCAIISSTSNSLTKGETVIEVNISDLELKVLVHELNHVYYQLCEICSIDLDKASQEWHSYTLEYLYDQLDKLTKFEKKTIVL